MKHRRFGTSYAVQLKNIAFICAGRMRRFPVIACPVADGACLAGILSTQKLVAKILEICRDAEIAALHELNNSLQIVFLSSGDANLSILQLALHFESF